ncbi:unnamed protein product, partial [Timema podura]|nr:unnamed protein product [Timema podura]
HPTEIRTSISPSSAVELNTNSALANYATEAGCIDVVEANNREILCIPSSCCEVIYKNICHSNKLDKGNMEMATVQEQNITTLLCAEIKRDQSANLTQLKVENNLRNVSRPSCKSHSCTELKITFALRNKKPDLKIKKSQKKSKNSICVCVVCNSVFNCERGLARHMLSHSEERPFECELCDSKFKFKNQLKGHKQTHLPEKLYFCYVCGAKFTLFAYLKSHMISHKNDKPFACSYCDSKFRRKEHLKGH